MKGCGKCQKGRILTYHNETGNQMQGPAESDRATLNLWGVTFSIYTVEVILGSEKTKI